MSGEDTARDGGFAFFTEMDLLKLHFHRLPMVHKSQGQECLTVLNKHQVENDDVLNGSYPSSWRVSPTRHS